MKSVVCKKMSSSADMISVHDCVGCASFYELHHLHATIAVHQVFGSNIYAHSGGPA
jgi:hypothetical protein